MVLMRRALIVLGPAVGILGAGYLFGGRARRAFFSAGAGWILLLDAFRSVDLAMDGGPPMMSALGAAMSVWLYLLLACFVGWRTWPSDDVAPIPTRAYAAAQ